MVTDEPIATDEGVPSKEFSTVRKGYNPIEVDEYLAEVDVAFREFEEYAARLKQELAEAKIEMARLEASEQASIDGAMIAVFDAKERIMERARLRAQEIEDEAHAGVQTMSKAEESSDDIGTPGADTDEMIDSARWDVVNPETAEQLATNSVEDSAEVAALEDSAESNKIMREVLEEAYTIRSQLEAGMAAALDEIGRLQRDAEGRATALLDEARSEARHLRSAGKAAGAETGAIRDATSAPGARSRRHEALDDPKSDRPSRYSRNSAKLPRIGTDSGVSVLASMNELRNKLREEDEASRQVQEPPAS